VNQSRSLVVKMVDENGKVTWVTARGESVQRGRAHKHTASFLERYMSEWQASYPGTTFTVEEA
jgi:hypothetical protein